jgi:hypothetical protein
MNTINKKDAVQHAIKQINGGVFSLEYILQKLFETGHLHGFNKGIDQGVEIGQRYK